MSVDKIKLNKFVLYVSSIAIALFGVLYSFGEVKAETNFTEGDVVAYYPLNETCNDYFDNYNLSLHDAGGSYSISWVDTFFGNGLNVKGSSTSNTTGSSYCYSSDIDYIFPSADGDEFSISFWFKAGTAPTQTRLFSYGTRQNSTSGNFGVINFIISSNGKADFHFNTSGDYTDVYMNIPSGTFQYDGTIYHVVIVGQWGSNMTSKFKTYVNGSVVSDGVYGTATALPRINQKYAYNGLSLGANSYYQYAPYGQFGHNGDMGEFAIFNRILTSDEVALLGEKALSEILNSSDDYVLYYGENPANWGKIFPEIPFVYNVCDYVNNNIHTGIFYSLYNDDTDALIKSDELFSCSGIVKPSLATILSETDVIIKIETFNESLELTTIAESNVFTIPKYNFSLNGNDDFINYRHKQIDDNFNLSITDFNNPPFIYSYYDDLETGRDVDIEVEWNIKDDANIATGEICLVDADTDIATEFCIDELDRETTKKDIITLLNPEVESIKYYYLSYINSNSEIIQKSNSFAVVFSLLVDEGFLSSFTQESNLASSWIDKWVYRLLNVFPFNFILSIQRAWSLSETAALSSDLEFLDMSDSEGDIKAHFPKEWLGSATDMEIDIFGRDMIANGSQDALDLFANFKKFTKWLQYFLFAFAIFSLSKKIIAQLSDDKNNTF